MLNLHGDLQPQEEGRLGGRGGEEGEGQLAETGKCVSAVPLPPSWIYGVMGREEYCLKTDCVPCLRLTDTAFKQQRLKAWQPILTPRTVLPTIFIVGILFAPIGALLIWGSSLVRFPSPAAWS